MSKSKKTKKKLIKRVGLLPPVNLPLVNQEIVYKLRAIGKVTKNALTLVKKAFKQ